MPRSIAALLKVAPRDRGQSWVRSALQRAIELELSTIPPYLCALWSIKSLQGAVYDSIRRILFEEMKHFGLACNLLCAVGGNPRAFHPAATPRYPGPLPGGVRPGLIVALRGLSKDAIGNQFMQIEFPHPAVVVYHGARALPTIGHFYEQIAVVLARPTVQVVARRQLDYSEINLTRITSRSDALDAITTIRSEGEGAHGSPFVSPRRLAHFYEFAQMFWEREIVSCGSGGWGFCGARIPFPTDLLPMAPVPRGGYPQLAKARQFNLKYAGVLRNLERAWNVDSGGDAHLERAVDIMRELGPRSMVGLAQALMRKRRPQRDGNFGPDFHLW